jgi:hypothetical protein
MPIVFPININKRGMTMAAPTAEKITEPDVLYSGAQALGFGNQDDLILDGCGEEWPVRYTPVAMTKLLRTLETHRADCAMRWIKAPAKKLPIRRAKVDSTPAPEAAATGPAWKLWEEETTTDDAYLALLDAYATVHKRTSREYKALANREPWWANIGDRWYLAFEATDDQVWFFTRDGKRTVHHTWPDKYTYYKK